MAVHSNEHSIVDQQDSMQYGCSAARNTQLCDLAVKNYPARIT